MYNPNIVFVRKDVAELVDRPVPEPDAGEVRVRLVRSCISSGTERANLIGVPDCGVGIFNAGDGVTWPRQSGYSSSGVVDAIAPYGRIALLGCTRNSNFTIDYYHKVHGRGVTLVGAHTLARMEVESAPGWWTQRDDALAFLRLAALGRIDLSGFVEEIHPPAKCGEVYSRLAKGATFPIVQFNWEELK